MKQRFFQFFAIALSFMITAPLPAQVIEHSKATDHVSVQVARHAQPAFEINDFAVDATREDQILPPALDASVHYSNLVEVTARHADGTIFYHHVSHNLLTNAGKDVIASAVSNTGTQAAACNYIALTNTAITPAAGDTTLSGEITVNGLARAQAAYAHTNGTSTYTLTKTFTATATQASQAAGVFNASSSGSMCFENTYTQVTLNNTDTLTVTWTITLS